MQDRCGTDIPASRFAVRLAELSRQLRHSYAGESPGADLVAGQSRLLSAAVLVRALGEEMSQPDLIAAGAAALDLAQQVSTGGQTAGRELGPALARLADWLERVLAQADARIGAEDLARAPRWDTVAAALAGAGTPQALLTDLADELAIWADRYDEAELTGDQEVALTRRWREIRDYGDALFGGRDSLLGSLLDHDPT